jgi:hypothetical protein
MSPKVKEEIAVAYREPVNFDDAEWRRETIERLSENGGAHVYTDLDHVVISSRPLSPRAVRRAVSKEHLEMAREDLKRGEAPGEVWGSYFISGASIARIAKEEGIKLPRHWFKHAWEAANPGQKY